MVVKVCTPTPGTVKAGALGLVRIVWPLAVPTNRAKPIANKGRIILIIPHSLQRGWCPNTQRRSSSCGYLLVHKLCGHALSSELAIPYTHFPDNQISARERR